MSFRLLDIIVTKRSNAEFQKVSAQSVFLYLQDLFAVSSFQFRFH